MMSLMGALLQERMLAADLRATTVCTCPRQILCNLRRKLSHSGCRPGYGKLTVKRPVVQSPAHGSRAHKERGSLEATRGWACCGYLPQRFTHGPVESPAL